MANETNDLNESFDTMNKQAHKSEENAIMREFESGAKRDTDIGKVNYLKALSPLVLKAYGEFMRKNNSQRDGEKRDEDNWKKGMTKQSYMESKFRHFMTTWTIYDGFLDEDIIESLLAELFNTMGLLHVLLLEKQDSSSVSAAATAALNTLIEQRTQ